VRACARDATASCNGAAKGAESLGEVLKGVVAAAASHLLKPPCHVVNGEWCVRRETCRSIVGCAWAVRAAGRV